MKSSRSEPFEKIRFRRPEQFGSPPGMRPVFLDFHLMQVRRPFEYPAHVHSAYELILVERGPYRCALNGAELILSAGDVLVIEPGDTHQDHLLKDQRHFVLHFKLDENPMCRPGTRLFKAGVSPEFQISRGEHQRDSLLLGEIGIEASKAGTHSAVIQDRLLEILFWRTIRSLPVEGLSSSVQQLPKQERVRHQLVAVMLAHLQHTVSMPELARKIKVSPRQLEKSCRELCGLSPAKLFLSLKIDRAESLMREDHLRVKEVSERLGFANPYHFSRAFKRLRGVAPTLSP